MEGRDEVLHRHRAKQALGLGNAYCPRPFSGLFLASTSPTAAGHLGLVRASATPALRDLLTPGAFLLDATNALGAVALRILPHSAVLNCYIRDAFFPRELARAEAHGDSKNPEALRLLRALIDAEDGRFKDAFDDLAHLAEESPDCYPARLCAAGVCDMLGRVDEADRWLAGIPAERCPRECIFYNLAIVTAALGGAAGAVAGARGRVVSAAFRVLNKNVSDGEMSAFETIITGLLKHAVKRRCKEDLPPNHGDDGILRALADAFSLSGSVPKGQTFYVLRASQALLSAVVLGARPLSGDRVSAAVRDLARAVEEGDAAAVCDLRLLLAFLDARDGRFDDALARYEEVARDDPSDPRPHFLALAVCVVAMRPVEEYEQWKASYRRLCLAPGLSLRDRVALVTLMEELLVALALASPTAFKVGLMDIIVSAAGNRVDAALVSALRSKNLSVVEWMELRAARASLYAGMWSSLKKYEGEHGGSGTTTVD